MLLRAVQELAAELANLGQKTEMGGYNGHSLGQPASIGWPREADEQCTVLTLS